MLIPSIDLYNGQAVQWRQGQEKVLARNDVRELLQDFSLYGEVALIDLNAALGEGDNRALIEELLKLKACRVGGGIRTLELAKNYLKAGATKIILGTASRDAWVDKLPKNSLVFAIDAKGDEWVTRGWKEGSGEKVLELIPSMATRCSEFLYTQVQKEGMLQGLDETRVRAVLKASPIPVTVAGGISSLEDVTLLRTLGANAQIGMALYTGRFTAAQAFVASIDFEKQPLIPTVVQDVESSEVLMLAYSTPESLQLALSERVGVYFSRSRQKLWKKGESSGHTQRLVRADFDCDGDTILFQVRQHDVACHLNRWSCFPAQQQRFSLSSLDAVLAQRQVSASPTSYTAQLYASAALQAEKLREETEELIEATTPEHVRWEAADLLYFALVNARAKGVSLAEIENELRSRHT
jgi:phosphoribosyl-AMP cyclohydrolase / phosphoribosyl-ATP pyrophosphohydrolase